MHLNWFTLNETQIIQSILLNKFNITSYLVQEFNSDFNRRNREEYKVRDLILYILHYNIN
jgi:hypothetical protein